MRAFGRAGAFAAHLPGAGGDPDLVTAIRAMTAAGEHCLSTSFCMWCQDALGWYIYLIRQRRPEGDARPPRRDRRGARRHRAVEPDEDLLRDRADPPQGQARRRAATWCAARCRSSPISAPIITSARCSRSKTSPSTMSWRSCRARPRASRSTATPSSSRSTAPAPSRCRCATCMIPDAQVLADPSDDYIKRIRAGFVLLQAGMAFGLIRDCIALMQPDQGAARPRQQISSTCSRSISASSSNRMQSAGRTARRDAVRDRSELLARGDRGAARRGEASVAAAQAAMLHCGARGYVADRRGAAAAARSLLRRHRHAGDQAAQEDAGRHGALNMAN